MRVTMRLSLFSIALLTVLAVTGPVTGRQRPNADSEHEDKKTSTKTPNPYDDDDDDDDDDAEEEDEDDEDDDDDDDEDDNNSIKVNYHRHHHSKHGKTKENRTAEEEAVIKSFNYNKKRPPAAFRWLAGPDVEEELRNVTDEVAEWLDAAARLYGNVFRATAMPILENFVAPFIHYAFGPILSYYVGPMSSEFLGPLMGGMIGQVLGYGGGGSQEEGERSPGRDGDYGAEDDYGDRENRKRPIRKENKKRPTRKENKKRPVH